MKIVITYEKKDIIRLVAADMRAQGIVLKAGTDLSYKGPLEVKFAVETDDALPAPVEVPPTLALLSKLPDEPSIVPKIEEVQDMDAILNASQRLVKAPNGKMRVLGANEFLEPPKA